jgi:Caspase domain
LHFTLETAMRKKLAVVVGVASYKNEEDKLPFCKDDVDLMEDVLSKKGFVCQSRVDLDLRPVRDILSAVATEAASPQDTIFFYFSGHGAELLGEQFLLGREGSLSSLDHALNRGDVIRLSEVLEALADSPALKLVIVDACRTPANIRPEEIDRFGPNILDQRRLAFQHIANCVIAFASADGQKSRGDDGKGSLFTLELARELANYNRDFVHSVQSAIAALRGKNAAQIPWVYASTYSSIVPDRLQIDVRSTKRQHHHLYPDKFIGFSAGAVHGLKEARLLKFSRDKWSVVGKIHNCGDVAAIAFAEHSLSFTAVRGRSAYVMIARPASPDESTGTTLELRKIGTSKLSHVFGTSMSPGGERVAVYGEPNEPAPGLACWRIDNSAKTARLTIEGLPDGQCNAAQWTSSTEGYASFSKADSERSSVFAFEITQNGKCTGSVISIIESRITALHLVEADTLWAGDTTGALVKISLVSSKNHQFSRPHPLDVKLARPCKKGWKGIDDDYMKPSHAVEKLTSHPELSVLAVSYYDQSVAFFDLESETYMATFAAEHFPRFQPISRTSEESFYAIRGFDGTLFELAKQ